MIPGAAAVGGFVNAVANGEIRPAQTLAAAYIDDFRIGRSYGQRSNRLRLPFENRLPGVATVSRLPYAAVVHPNQEHAGLRGNPSPRHRPPATERPNHAPVHVAVERGHILPGSCGGKDKTNRSEQPNRTHETTE